MHEAQLTLSRHVNSQINTYCCYEHLSAFGEVSLCDLKSQNLMHNSCTQNNDDCIFQRIKFQLIFLINSHTIIQDINRQENVPAIHFLYKSYREVFHMLKQVFMLLWWCSWGLRSSESWHHITGLLVPDSLMWCSGLIFKGRNVQISS